MVSCNKFQAVRIFNESRPHEQTNFGMLNFAMKFRDGHAQRENKFFFKTVGIQGLVLCYQHWGYYALSGVYSAMKRSPRRTC